MSLQAGNDGAGSAADADTRPGVQPVILEDRPVQLEGSRFARFLMRLLGWTLEFEGLPTRQGVVVVYPHTSNWDFPIGLLAKWGMGLSVAFWAKDSLFKKPIFGRWMRHIGGVPVDRSGPHDLVASAAASLRAATQPMQLVVPPEGTRGRTRHWKTGFWFIAQQAGVPILLAYMDYQKKEAGIGPVLVTSGDVQADLARVKAFYADVRGRNATQFSAE